MRLHDILQMPSRGDQPMTVRQLPPDYDYMPLLKEIAGSHETRFILDGSLDKLKVFFKLAHIFNLTEVYQVRAAKSIYYSIRGIPDEDIVRFNLTNQLNKYFLFQSYIITSVDAYKLDSTDLHLVESNITTYRMINSRNLEFYPNYGRRPNLDDRLMEVFFLFSLF